MYLHTLLVISFMFLKKKIRKEKERDGEKNSLCLFKYSKVFRITTSALSNREPALDIY